MTEEFSDNEHTQSHVPLTAGTMISHYKISRRIGAGGMGEVYLAEDQKLGREVAIKFLPLHMTYNESFKARFSREAQAVARLNHPNVVTIYEVGEHKGRPYFIMEFVGGQTVNELIRSGSTSIDRAIELMMDLCAGLSEAHQSGIFHRDIKPTNILLTKSGNAKLVDFGLATRAGTEKLTATGSRLGTAGYMSPEQVKGEAVDHRSDIFSLGVVLYEMLAGRRPFQKESEVATDHAIVHEAPEPVARFKTDVPDELQRIVEKALEKDPGMRYQHVDDMLADLKRLKRERNSGVSVLPAASELSQPMKSRASVFVSWSVIVILVLVLLGLPDTRRHIFDLLGIGGVPDQKHLVVLPMANIGQVPANQAFCDGLMETLTSRITHLERFQGSLWVVPASEVRERAVKGVREARRAFGVTLAVTGSIQRLGDYVRLTLNVVDAESERQLRSLVIDDSLDNVSALQDSSVLKLAEMLEVELQPDQEEVLTAGGTNVAAAYDVYVQGMGLLRRQYQTADQIDSAIGQFKKAVELDPDYALAFAGLGESYWLKFKKTKEPEWIDSAVQHCHAAIEISTDLAPVYVTLGLIHNETGRYEQAAVELQRALEVDPYSFRASVALSESYTALRLPEKAEEVLRRAIKLKPDFWANYFSLELFYLQQGRYDDAIHQLNKVVELLPEDFQAHNDLGALYFALERWKQARMAWGRSLEIDPNYAAYSNLGTLHYMQAHFDSASHMYEKALELDDRDYQVWGNLASSYHWQEKIELARDAYRKAIEMAKERMSINQRDPVLLSHLAGYHASVGNEALARQFLKSALDSGTDNIDILVQAAAIHEEFGNRDSALFWLDKAVTAGYSQFWIERTPDFKQLIRDPEFERLVSSSNE